MKLIINNLSHAYGDQETLKQVSFSVDEGEVLALLGPSGCGKSTLLRLIAGLETLQAGSIHLGEDVLASPSTSPPPEKRPVGLVFQEHALFPGMTVGDNIEFGLSGLSETERRKRREDLLSMIGLPQIAGRLPGTLSGGQQQRVALARALAPEPKVMLLDEPYASVDVLLRRQLQESARLLLKNVNSATILVTHDPEEALEMSDRIAVMGEGGILQIDTPEVIVHKPSCVEVAQLFGDAQTLTGHMETDCFVTSFGKISLSNRAIESASRQATQLVARPSGLTFRPDTEGQFKVLDVRYRSSGKLLLVGTQQGKATNYLRVDQDDGVDVNVGECGEVIARDNNTFLF